MRALRILLLEDDEFSREVLREAAGRLDSYAVTLTEADSLFEGRRLLAQTSFDLVLADLVLPDGVSIDTIRYARSLAAPPIVLVVSSLADEDVVVQAIVAGACGYLSKNDDPADIARAIEIAADGGSCISPTIAHRLMELLRKQVSGATGSAKVDLTDCEQGILTLASKGHNYRQIAQITGTRPSTVYTHVRHVYEKLQVSNLAQALFEARRHQLV